jgi:hypothetical protein
MGVVELVYRAERLDAGQHHGRVSPFGAVRGPYSVMVTTTFPAGRPSFTRATASAARSSG